METGPARGTGTALVDAFGLVLMFAGAVLCGISFVGAPWYSVSGGVDSAGTSLQFADLHTNADSLAAPVAAGYFDRFAWGLVGIAVLIGVLARAVRLGSAPLRLIAFLVAIVGFVLTYYALAQLFNAQRNAGGSGHGVLHSASYGLYIAFAGYAVIALGSVLGHRRSPARRVPSAL